jgi:hypothetical protein
MHVFLGLVRVSLRLGEYDLSSEEDCSPGNRAAACPSPPRDYVPSELVLHSGFNQHDKQTFMNDIALIRLQTKVELSGTDMNIQTRVQRSLSTATCRLERSESTCMYTYMLTCICTYTHTHILTYVHAYIHTYIYIQSYIYTHTIHIYARVTA